jgi:hypothetical protein
MPGELSATSAMELKENTVIVVLGASGDLAKKKTVSTTLCEVRPVTRPAFVANHSCIYSSSPRCLDWYVTH